MKTQSPDHGPVPAELIREWKERLGRDMEAGTGEAVDYYFESILPLLLPHLEVQSRRHKGCDLLVSLMGFSPETTIIATVLLKPKRLLIVYSEKAADCYNRAFGFLVANKFLTPVQIQPACVPPVDPASIYEEIHRFIRTFVDKADTDCRVVVDVTGGKKIMSAAAAQAAWDINIPLCYVDSRRYEPQTKRPLPGFEELVLLENPSIERALERRKNSIAIYERCEWQAAISAFEASASWNADHVLEELGVALTRCYLALSDLDLRRLLAAASALRAETEKRTVRQLLHGSGADGYLVRHVSALESVANGDELALIAAFLKLATIYRSQERHDFSCLLSYRAMEALVQTGLSRAAGASFDLASPDYARLGDRYALGARYAELCRAIGYGDEPELPSRLHLLSGLAILCLCAGIHSRLLPGATPEEAVSMMRELATRRNRSVLAHGSMTLGPDDSQAMREQAWNLATAAISERELTRLDELLNCLDPCRLPLSPGSRTARSGEPRR